MCEMTWVVHVVARLVRASYVAWGRKWLFGILALIAFGANVAVLARLDLLPNHGALKAAPENSEVATTTEAVLPEDPLTISVISIGLNAKISNPTSTTIAVLDAALLKGAVRYPTSARLGESGNVVLFGHSSYLPVVHNQAYKTFDGIQNLKRGDTIIVSSGMRIYTYAVTTVKKENTETGVIPLAVTGRLLTLATCDSFGTKSDRFVVTAEFVESHLISPS